MITLVPIPEIKFDGILEDEGFVRRCQTHACHGTLFAFGERSCRKCERPRPHSSAAIEVLGASFEEWLAVKDALDAEFNSLSFVGLISGRISHTAPGKWSIDDADLFVPAWYDAKVVSPYLLFENALKRAGLRAVRKETVIDAGIGRMGRA